MAQDTYRGHEEVSRHPYILVEEECRGFIESRHCYCLYREEKRVSRGCRDCVYCLVEYPYEEAYKTIIDLEKGVVARSFVVVPGGSREGLLVERGSEVVLVEIDGVGIEVGVSEGQTVRIGDKIAHVFTGKREVRTVRSGTEGLVVYVTDLYGEYPHKVLIVLLRDSGHVGRVSIE